MAEVKPPKVVLTVEVTDRGPGKEDFVDVHSEIRSSHEAEMVLHSIIHAIHTQATSVGDKRMVQVLKSVRNVMEIYGIKEARTIKEEVTPREKKK